MQVLHGVTCRQLIPQEGGDCAGPRPHMELMLRVYYC